MEHSLSFRHLLTNISVGIQSRLYCLRKVEKDSKRTISGSVLLLCNTLALLNDVLALQLEYALCLLRMVYWWANRFCETEGKQTAMQYISGEWQGRVAILFRTYCVIRVQPSRRIASSSHHPASQPTWIHVGVIVTGAKGKYKMQWSGSI